MPGMRTSEIIMFIFSSDRNTPSARSPESTTVVLNPWLVRKEFNKLRCPGSSSTIRIRGVVGIGFLAASGGIIKRISLDDWVWEWTPLEAERTTWFSRAPFPLTPALSLGEREHRLPPRLQTNTLEFVQAEQTGSPSPIGRGSG